MADIILKDVSFPKDDDILSVDIYSDNKAKCYSWSSKWIDAIPVDEAAPVRRGRWLRTPTWWLYCSECGSEQPNECNAKTPYCPNCGAKMEVDQCTSE